MSGPLTLGGKVDERWSNLTSARSEFIHIPFHSFFTHHYPRTIRIFHPLHPLCQTPFLLWHCNPEPEPPAIARARLISGETAKAPNMRFSPTTLLYALYATGLVSAVSATAAKAKATEEEASDELKPTVFNGVEVPPLPDLNGDKFNETVKEGYWFVKHHS